MKKKSKKKAAKTKQKKISKKKTKKKKKASKAKASNKGGMRSKGNVDVIAKFLFRQREDLMKMRKASENRHKKANSFFDVSDEGLELFNGIRDQIKKLEEDVTKKCDAYIENHPLGWLFDKYFGISLKAGLALIGNIDPYRGSTVSKMWVPCGLGMEYHYRVTYFDILKHKGEEVKRTSPETREVWGTSEQSALNAIPMPKTIRKGGKKILVEVDRQGLQVVLLPDPPERQRMRVGQSPTYNNELKCAIVGTVGDGIHKQVGNLEKGKIRSEKDLTYVKMHQSFLREERTQNPEMNKSQIRWRAVRKTMKEFIKEFYVEYRTLMGLPVRKPYNQAVLNKKPHGQKGSPGNSAAAGS